MAYREPASRVEEVPVKWTARVKWHRVAWLGPWLAGGAWAVAHDAGYQLGPGSSFFTGASLFVAVVAVGAWNVAMMATEKW